LDALSSLVELDAHRAVVRGVSHSGGHELAVGLGQRAVGVADHLGGGSDALRVEAGHAESQIFFIFLFFNPLPSLLWISQQNGAKTRTRCGRDGRPAWRIP
jgi:hypothetical protein